MRLDHSQPYVEILGIPGVAFEQDGRRFSAGGSEVLVQFDRSGGDEVITVLEVPDNDNSPLPAAPADGNGFRHLHWRHLKALVETYDHPWVDKEDAVAFLEQRT